MKLPKKLKHDYLQDAILEIRFYSDFSDVLIPGILKTHLKDFRYVPPRQIRKPVAGSGSPLMSIETAAGLFVKEKDYFGVKYLPGNPGSLSINMTQKYRGWKAYRDFLYEIMQAANKGGIIDNISRMGLRYISVHPVENVFNCIDGTFSLSINDESISNENATLRVEDVVDGYKRIIQVANRKRSGNDKNDNKHWGIFDIDMHAVSSDDQNLSDFDSFWGTVDHMHTLQKQSYFGLLTQEYLKSLGPEY